MMITANDGFIEQSERYAFNNAGESLKRYIVLQKGELAYNHGASKLRPYGSCFSLINQEKARIPFVYHCFSVEKHNPEFVSIELNGNDVERQLRRIVSSGARMDGLLNISFQDYASISVLLPKKAEQDKIASAFRNLDNLTTLHQRKQNDLFLLILGKKSSSILANDWEQRKLGEVAQSFEYGLNVAAKEYDGINKYLRITDIDDVSRKFDTDNLTSPDTELAAVENYRLVDGDILFARTGASVGKSYIYRVSDGLVYFAGFLIRAKIKPEYDAEFVFQNTLSESYEKYVQITSQRSGQPGVNAQEYSDYVFYLPTYDEQQKIGAFLRNLDNFITLHQCKQEAFLSQKRRACFQSVEGKSTLTWEQRKLGDILQTLPFKQFLKEPEMDGKYEVIQQGGEPIIGFANGTPCTDYKDIVIFGDHTLSLYKPKQPFFVATDGVRILKGTKNVDGFFLLFLLERYKPQSEGYKRYFNILSDIECFMSYNISEQKKIGAFFDTLDNLITLHQRGENIYNRRQSW